VRGRRMRSGFGADSDGGLERPSFKNMAFLIRIIKLFMENIVYFYKYHPKVCLLFDFPREIGLASLRIGLGWRETQEWKTICL
jgi:hypothetical protein